MVSPGEFAEEIHQREKLVRARNYAILVLGCVLVSILFYLLFVTNVIPVRRNNPTESKSPTTAHVSEALFGKTKQGEEVWRFTLRNDNGMEIQLISFGATITSVKIPDNQGHTDDVVLGYDTLSEYESENNPFFGSTVGRYANRIARGTFELDGVTYQLTINNGLHHLHGGVDNWSRRIWRSSMDEKDGSVTFSISSSDGDQGYPGQVEASVHYQLTTDNCIVISFSATTHGGATPVSLTNHAYFNLAGHDKGTIEDHHVEIYAENYLPVTDDIVPTGEIANVTGTPFDLRSDVRLGDVLGTLPGRGFDHNFCLRGPTGKRYAARVRHDPSGRSLLVFTNQPGIQFYTGNFLNGTVGKNNAVYNKHAGLTLETQNYPNAPNEAHFPDSILRPGSTYLHQCWYKFQW